MAPVLANDDTNIDMVEVYEVCGVDLDSTNVPNDARRLQGADIATDIRMNSNSILSKECDAFSDETSL